MLEGEIVGLLKGAGLEASEEMLEQPPQPDFGDIAFPCFNLAKTEKRNPQEIAQGIAKKIGVSLPESVLRAEARGGYVNFFFDWAKISSKVLKGILTEDEAYGNPAKIKKQKIMVEYSQPNPVHSMHIGHARGTFLGDALANLFDFLGHKVVRANYMNDTGLQVAKLVTAYQLWADGKEPEEKPDFWLWKYYVKFHEEAAKDPSLEDRARENLRLIDVEKDKAATALRDRIVEWCVEGFEQTYRKVGIKFDVYLNESDFREAGKKIVQQALAKGLAFKSGEKTVVADLEKHGLPSFVILRSDGTGLYQTSDLGMTVYKFEHFSLDKSVWVVASAQNLYFKQLFKLLELLGYKWVKDCVHFSFDLVRLPEGKMSSREGRAVLLDEVISKLGDMAYEEVNKRNPDESEPAKRRSAMQIGVGALKYAIEKVEPEKGITFDFEKMLSFDGNTGPYLQYAHTRCASILEKSGKGKVDVKKIKMKELKMKDLKKEEKGLVKVLADFPNVVEQAAKEMRINLVCNYAYELATVFSTFYQFCPVLKAGSEQQKGFRLALVAATKVVLKNSLSLLGIEAMEKM